jgi:predicted phage-related endonuclease
VSDDGKFLVETKNYHGMSIKSFSDQDEPVKVPTADYVQCLHEAIVYGVSTVFLAVLFGGQRFRTYRFDFSEEEKLAHIEYLCGLWKHVQDGTLPTAESYEDAKLSFTRDNGNNIVANADIEMIVEALAGVKASIKALEEREAFLQGKIMVYMGEHSELINISGEKLATWKAAKPSQVFDMTLFKTMSPDLHKRFLVEKPGSRRFLVK